MTGPTGHASTVTSGWSGTHPALRRHPANPVLGSDGVPGGGLVFNAGVAHFDGRYVMVFRNEGADLAARALDGTIRLGLAASDDGVHWHVSGDTVRLTDDPTDPLWSAYDPRLTVVDGRLWMGFACGGHGVRGGIAVTDDLVTWDVLSLSAPDNRNMVLFPERIDGRLVRLERPMAGYLRPGDRFDIWLSTSPDGRDWGGTRRVVGTGSFPWVNDKIGPGTPPVRTPRGWLSMIHGVDRDPQRRGGWEGDWTKRYCGALMLTDLEDPGRVVALSEGPVLVPEAPYELDGFRGHVVFPTAMLLDADGTVRIWYGAADTVMAVVDASLDDLLAACVPA